MSEHLDCGDGGCVFRYAGPPESRGGMRTNGGCKCLYLYGPLDSAQREQLHRIKRGVHALIERIRLVEGSKP
jgi:hypothetical protein